MNKLRKMTIKLAAVAQILAITLLAGGALSTPSTVCQATSDLANPYEIIAVNLTQLNEHRVVPNDINPAPVSPTSPVAISNGDGKITICHATSSETNLYNEITVSVDGLNGHGKHEGDIIPAPEGGCPTTR
jgi:hypothetical protein